MEPIDDYVDQWKHCADAHGFVHKWMFIAQVLEVSEPTARKVSRWGVSHRAPVFVDHRGCPVARLRELVMWKRDRVLPYGLQRKAVGE